MKLPILSSNTQLGIQQQLRKLYERIAEHNGVIPDLCFNNTSYQGLRNYLDPIHRKAQKCEFGVGEYVTGVGSLGFSAYHGAVYAPTLNRIYLIPSAIANQANWHYIDCNTGEVVTYAHNLGADTPVSEAYYYGCYDPYNDIIWMSPYAQGPESKWHYIDGKTGEVVAYTHGIGVVANYSYLGAIFSPLQNRVYFSPGSQYDQGDYHYVNCDTKNIEAYTPTTPVPNTCAGGAYDPINNRIYFAPYYFPATDGVAYLDCNDGSINILSTVSGQFSSGAYIGAIFAPTLKRIYFIPYSQGPEVYWHYIDCDTNQVVAYENGVTTENYAYEGASYSPVTNRIYMAPMNQATQSTLHYIDGKTGEVVAYNPVTVVRSRGGIYVPSMSRIYLIPSGNGTQSLSWNYIQEYTDVEVSRSLTGGGIYNKTP